MSYSCVTVLMMGEGSVRRILLKCDMLSLTKSVTIEFNVFCFGIKQTRIRTHSSHISSHIGMFAVGGIFVVTTAQPDTVEIIC